MKFQVQYLPTIFPTNYDAPNVAYDESSHSVDDPSYWTWVMYNFGYEAGSLGQMQRTVEAPNAGEAIERCRTTLVAELAGVLNTETDKITLSQEESIPVRNGWFHIGGPGTTMLYAATPGYGGSDAPRLLRTQVEVETGGRRVSIAMVYGFLVVHVQEQGS